MSLLQSVQKYFRDRSLKKVLAEKSKEKKRQVNILSAKKIGILFDATQLDVRTEALQYVKRLKDRQKKVSVLGYIDGHQRDAHFPFSFFDKKALNWAKIPGGEEVKTFLQEKFDIFIYLNPTSSVPSEYIAALTNAHLKVGPIAEKTEVYDLMIEVRNKSNLQAFTEQLESILLKTNVEHEAA